MLTSVALRACVRRASFSVFLFCFGLYVAAS